jgi:hypothetical protein
MANKKQIERAMEGSFKIALKQIFKIFNEASSPRVYDLILCRIYRGRMPFPMVFYSNELGIIMSWYKEKVNLKVPKVKIKDYSRDEEEESDVLLEVAILYCYKKWGVRLHTNLLMAHRKDLQELKDLPFYFYDLRNKGKSLYWYGQMVEHFNKM